MVNVAVAGNEFTLVGVMLQLPRPYVAGQLRATVPLNPSSDVIEIGALAPVLPAFISGKVIFPRTKSGFVMTFNVNDVVRAVGAPAVAAWRVTG